MSTPPASHDGEAGEPVVSPHLPSVVPGALSKEVLARHPIRRAAEIVRVHPQTLRDYDRQGLVRPARTQGGRRLYTDRDLERVKRVRELTNGGVPVAATKRILRLEDVVRAAFDRIRVLEDQNRRLSDRLRRLELSR